jgi:hypothetical protein
MNDNFAYDNAKHATDGASHDFGHAGMHHSRCRNAFLSLLNTFMRENSIDCQEKEGEKDDDRLTISKIPKKNVFLP